jgi:chromosome segregation ATPase
MSAIAVGNDIENDEHQKLERKLFEVQSYITGWTGMLEDHQSGKNNLSSVEIDIIIKAMNRAKAELKDCCATIASLRSRHKEIESNLLMLNNKINNLETALSKKDEEIKNLKGDVQILQKKVDAWEKKPIISELAKNLLTEVLSDGVLSHNLMTDGTALNDIQKFSCYVGNKTVKPQDVQNAKEQAFKSMAKKLKVTDGEEYFKTLWKFRENRNIQQHPTLFKSICRDAINSLYQPNENEYVALTTYLNMCALDEEDPATIL